MVSHPQGPDQPHEEPLSLCIICCTSRDVGLGDAAQCCHSPPGQPLAAGGGGSGPDPALIAVLPAGCVFSQLIPALFVQCTQGTVLRDGVRPSGVGGAAWAAQWGGGPRPQAWVCRQSQALHAVGLGRGKTPGCSPPPRCHSCAALGLPGAQSFMGGSHAPLGVVRLAQSCVGLTALAPTAAPHTALQTGSSYTV